MLPKFYRSSSLLLSAILTLGCCAVASAQTALYTNMVPSYIHIPPYKYGYEISGIEGAGDSFTISAPAEVTSVDFVTFNDPGATTDEVDWEISSLAFGGTVYGSSTSAVTDTFVENTSPSSPDASEDVNNDAFSLPSVILSTSGTYYLDITDAISSDAGNVYWNDILGDSAASTEVNGNVYDNAGSEAFTINGAYAPEQTSALTLFIGLTAILSLYGVRLKSRNKPAA
jgi:hypothetical protein